jgi:hypothetical protein
LDAVKSPRTSRYALVAALLVLIASARIVSTYGPLSHTIDEPIHLGAGIEWLTAGTYNGDFSHPPLARAMAAIAVTLGGAKAQPADSAIHEGLLIYGNGAHYDRMLALSRLGILPLFWVACAAVFFWAWRAGGGGAAVAATLAFTTIPPVLAHAGLVTTDMAATAFCAAAAFCTLVWSERPTGGRSLMFGLVLGLGVLSKFSFLVYLPAAWMLWLAWRRPSLATVRGYARPALIAAITGCLIVWAGYRFTLAFPVPAPKFWEGIGLLWQHNAEGHNSYILGQRHKTGVWFFFPVTLAIKTPLALFGLALAALWRRPRGLGAPALYCLAILLVAMSSRINIGVRHVLPLYAGLAVIAGCAAAAVWRTRARLMVPALFVWQIVSGATHHPDYISYTNEIAGDHPEAFIAESDLDWGQDMHRVGDFLHRMGATEVSFTPYNVTYLEYGHPFPKCTFTNWYHPAHGWNVVSLSGLKVFNHPGWAEGRTPQYRIGRTHWAWYFP